MLKYLGLLILFVNFISAGLDQQPPWGQSKNPSTQPPWSTKSISK